MKVLLLGEHYSDNLGDSVISFVFQKYMNEIKIDYDILDLSGRENKKVISENCVNKRMGIKKIISNFKYIRYIRGNVARIKKIKSNSKINKEIYDAAIYIGGSIFMGYFAFVQFYLNKKLKRKKIPIYYYGCGMGYINNKLEKRYIKKALASNNIKEIYVRDSELELNNYFCKSIMAKKSVDIALLTSLFSKPKVNKSIKIGIGYIFLDPEFEINFEKSTESLIEHFENSCIEWELFTNGDAADFAYAKKFWDRISSKKIIKFGGLRRIPQTAEDLIEDIFQYNKIVGTRLHSLILSYSFNIPAIAISWSNKIDSFYSDICHTEWVFKNNYNSLEVFDLLMKIRYSDFDRINLQKMQNTAMLDLKSMMNRVKEKQYCICEEN